MKFHILGGGPSIADLDVTTLKGRLIACNNAGLDVCPDADALVVMDGRWIDWNKDRLHENRSELRICTQKPKVVSLDQVGFELWDRAKGMAVSHALGGLAGECSGAMAINLAYLLGASEIALHGFEMKPVGNYHDDHKVKTQAHLFEDKFIPSILRMVAAMAGECRVVNVTPDSALKIPEYA